MSPRDPYESSAPTPGAEHWSNSGNHVLTEEEWQKLQEIGRQEDERARLAAAEEKTPEPVRWAAKHVGLKTVAAVVGVLLVNAFALGGIWWGLKAHAQSIDTTVAEVKATAEAAKAEVVAVEKKNAEAHADIEKTVARVAQAVDDQVAQSKATNVRLDQVVQLLVQVAQRRVPEPSPAPPRKAPKEPLP